MPVYAVKSIATGAVKIGFTKGDPNRRLHDLRCGNHAELQMRGILPGGKELEAALHKRFAGYRIRGEWFSIPEADLEATFGAAEPEYDGTAESLPTRLAAIGVRSSDFRLWGQQLSGCRIARSTVLRWLRGERKPDPWALALTAVVENPDLIRKLRRRAE